MAKEGQPNSSLLLTSTAVQAVAYSKATGSIVMSGPPQAAEFAVFGQHPNADKGSMTYANFDAAGAGSGVWVPASSFDVAFGVDPAPSIMPTYGFTINAMTPTSPTSLDFSRSGDGPDPWVSTFERTVDGSLFSLTMIDINSGNPTEAYTLDATGSASEKVPTCRTRSVRSRWGRVG